MNSRSNRSRALFWGVGALFLAGLAMRVWYGSGGLDPRRFWDERYALENVRSILEDGTLRPVRSYYPSPVFNLPAAGIVALLERVEGATGDDRWSAMSPQHFEAAGYMGLRAWQAFYGALTVVILFGLGRRLYGDAAGWLAAASLCFLPWHLHASGIFKPDVLLVLAVTWTLYATVRCLEASSTRWAIVTGVGIALAASAKLTGVLVAAPIAIATVWPSGFDLPRWKRLGVAALTSLVAFAVTNPYGWAYLHYLEALKRDYQMRADALGQTRLDVLRSSLEFFGDRWVHGRGASLVVLVTVVAVAIALWTRRSKVGAERDWRDAAEAGLVAYPILYLLVYVSQTTYFKPNNLLPVVPLTCLWLGLALARSGGFLRQAFPPRHRTLATVVLASLAAVWIVTPGWTYVYRERIPRTYDQAVLFLRQPMPRDEVRSVLVEGAAGEPEGWFGERSIPGVTLEVERLDGVPPEELRAADGLIFRGRRLVEPGARFHAALMAGAGRGNLQTFSPRLLSVRGESMVAVRRLHRAEGTSDFELRRCPAATLCRVGEVELDEELVAALRNDEVLLSVALVLPTPDLAPAPEGGKLRVNGDERPLHYAGKRGSSHLYTTTRFAPGARRLRIRFERDSLDGLHPGHEIRVVWSIWRPPPLVAGS